jgi:hypothetical protein
MPAKLAAAVAVAAAVVANARDNAMEQTVDAEGTCEEGDCSKVMLLQSNIAMHEIAADKHVKRKATKTSCDASTPPENGNVGNCTSSLAANATCQPVCNSGYTESGLSSCSGDGVFTAATCGAPVRLFDGVRCSQVNTYYAFETVGCADIENGDCTEEECSDFIKKFSSNASQLYFNMPPSKSSCGVIFDPDIDCTDSDNHYDGNELTWRAIYAVRDYSCNASIAPEHGTIGDCTDDLASGATCTPRCYVGYALSGEVSCNNGALTYSATCEIDSTHTVWACDASTPPANGVVGDCTDSLTSGTTCQPICNEGYFLSCLTYCYSGPLTMGQCNPPTLIGVGVRCITQSWIDGNARCNVTGCSPYECAQYIRDNADDLTKDCSQDYFNYGAKGGGCGCIDQGINCSDASNLNIGNDEQIKDAYAYPAQTGVACAR